MENPHTSAHIFWSFLSLASEDETKFVCGDQSEVTAYKKLAFDLEQLAQNDENTESVLKLKSGSVVEASKVKVVSLMSNWFGIGAENTQFKF